MDMHRLINEVKQRPALWDANHPEHANRVETQRQWRCVADALGAKGESESSTLTALSSIDTHSLALPLSLSFIYVLVAPLFCCLPFVSLF